MCVCMWTLHDMFHLLYEVFAWSASVAGSAISPSQPVQMPTFVVPLKGPECLFAKTSLTQPSERCLFTSQCECRWIWMVKLCLYVWVMKMMWLTPTLTGWGCRDEKSPKCKQVGMRTRTCAESKTGMQRGRGIGLSWSNLTAEPLWGY